MLPTDIAPGIHEVQSFEVDEYNCIRGVICGSQTLLQPDNGRPDGQLPFDAIFSDKHTSSLYQQLVEHVRTTAETISFPYRCDSETHLVYLRVVVFLSSSKNVSFLNKVTGYDARHAGVRLIREYVFEDIDYKNCSICNRLCNPATIDDWQEFQTLIENHHWPETNKTMRCAFDVCNDCEQALKQRMAETLRAFERRAA